LALARLSRATSHRTMLKRLHAVLVQAAAGRGQSAEALLDHLLPPSRPGPGGAACGVGRRHARGDRLGRPPRRHPRRAGRRRLLRQIRHR